MSAERTPEPEGSATLIVADEHLANRLATMPGEAYPAVFATASMIALMEVAAGRCLLAMLEPGELSVGVSIQVNHTAPTPPGERVTATARYIGRDGRKFRFEVVARDAAGEIGHGIHERAIVDEQRLRARAEGRRTRDQ